VGNLSPRVGKNPGPKVGGKLCPISIPDLGDRSHLFCVSKGRNGELWLGFIRIVWTALWLKVVCVWNGVMQKTLLVALMVFILNGFEH